MFKLIRVILVLLFFILRPVFPKAQTTAVLEPPVSDLYLGMELFQKEKYGAAQEVFSKVVREVENPFSPVRIQVAYYDALCAIELYNRDAASKLDAFVKTYPTSPYINRVHFQYGRLSYRDRKYSSALKSFEKVDIRDLSEEEKAEYDFKTGYCYFRAENSAEARRYFGNAVGSSTKYKSPAAYYLAHLDYSEGNYSSALEQFNTLTNDPNFKAIAPYYIVQIKYMQGAYAEVIREAPPLIVNATARRSAELQKILGESYYHTGQFDKALPHLEEYHLSATSRIRKYDHYVLGYTQYATGDYASAMKQLQLATGSNDSLSQFAWYYLAAAYLKEGQKKFAANAFLQAYKLPFDRDVREDALFNYAQLAFELSYDPYSEAVKSLRAYLKAYPDSKRSDEAYRFLFQISLATRNFEDAREALENIQVKGVDYKRDFQKITHYRAIELFNGFAYDEAAEMFKKALAYDVDPLIAAESKFWLAESFFRLDNHWAAKKYYLEFLASPQASRLKIFPLAHYNLAYTYFNRKEYNGSIYHFNEFIKSGAGEQSLMIADAYLRLGDSWFSSKNYDRAIEFYDKTIGLNQIDVDYALLQKSKALGVLLRYPEKILSLNRLISSFPSSVYLGEAYFELGNTHLVDRNPESALLNFKKVVSGYPQSAYAVKSRLKMGLIYYNSGLNDLAVQIFKEVVEDYPGTQESGEALASLKNLYVETGQADVYIAYASGLPYAGISVSEKDSLLYRAAENLYLDGKYQEAATSLESYVEGFPDGPNSLNARFFLAESLVQTNRPLEAVQHYELVAAASHSVFAERALLKAAGLRYDQGDYREALDLFKRLETVSGNNDYVTESLYGQMKCHYLLGSFESAVDPANRLLQKEKIPEDMRIESLLILARSHFESGDLLMAKSRFREIASISQGETGAEAKYTVALIEYSMKNLDAAESTVFELVNQYAPFDYWVASGFILLADVYVAKGNLFQAKQTLQSVINNHEGEELKTKAGEKLRMIQETEQGTVNSNKDASGNYTPEEDTIDLEEF